MKIYVGNLPWSTADADLEELFAAIGDVTSARVITDRDTGRSRGFGFVEMAQADGQKAIAELNGHQIESRALRVNEANEQQPRGSGGGGGRDSGGGGRDGGGGGGGDRW
jgi:RNA recognition motif-containing protein